MNHEELSKELEKQLNECYLSAQQIKESIDELMALLCPDVGDRYIGN